MTLVAKEVKKVMMRPWGVETQLRPTIIPDYLCFTAEQANSTIRLKKNNSPYAVTLETSTDNKNWSTYSFWTTITLSNVWDKIYRRNVSDEHNYFSLDNNNNYRFFMSWKIAASWDINFLLNKNSTDIVERWCFRSLFNWCTALTTAPQLPATTLGEYCYYWMFNNCSWLTTAPHLPATSLPQYCYREMFSWCTALAQLPYILATDIGTMSCAYMFNSCSNIKVASSSNSTYTQTYRIPKEWTWTATWQNATSYMFLNTWGTYTGSPWVNATLYAHKDIVLV